MPVGDIRFHPRDSIRFPPSGFKHYFTLFSKFFSSFPHGTCSLSVSRPYLALDEVYHPLKVALPSNPTRPRRNVNEIDPPTIYRTITFSGVPFQENLSLGGFSHCAFTDYISIERNPWIQIVSSSRFARRY